MRAVVLLSAGRHRISGRPAPVPVEMQAVRLALELGAGTSGLYAGPDWAGLRDCRGHGLAGILHLQHVAGDPTQALCAALLADPPDLVLCGRRGQGGADSGLLPYAVAGVLGWPILADVAGLRHAGEGVDADQAGLRGARRRVTMRLPCVLTVHPAAPPAYPFVHGLTAGRIEARAAPSSRSDTPALDERPYRVRPRYLPAAQAAEGARLLVHPAPQDAAAAIMTYLRGIGALPP